MKINVTYQNSQNIITECDYSLTQLGFIKHMVTAGQHNEPFFTKLIRLPGLYLTYIHYMKKSAFYNENRFSEPDISFSDPTQKSQFSNLAGRAIADFLSKKIDNSSFTVNYEAAMRIQKMPIKCSRPDLLAFRRTDDGKFEQFALEAKGFCRQSISDKKMLEHKKQASSGSIPVDFSVASISYNLYNSVKCKYYDPKENESVFDSKLFRMLTKSYYNNIFKNIRKYKQHFYKKINNENFYCINMLDLYKKIYQVYPLHSSLLCLFRERHFFLIVPERLEEYAEGMKEPLSTLKGLDEIYDNEGIYIDNDRIGLAIG
ncbi:hypothetical protein [Otariodibacter sp.]|uniref:hypothetical protein n=1 Tax=Otariodibacter sp. TaxID=3030919 RepID=UPI002630F36D|nr:hypothetical protein [Otariodibacter sp.]